MSEVVPFAGAQLADGVSRRVLKVYAVLDMKMKMFMTPWFAMNAAVASRMFADSINGEKNMVSRHPEDFALYELGEFEEATGFLLASDKPVSLGLASQFMEVGDAKLS